MWAGDPRETPMALRKPKYRYRNLPVSRAAHLPVSRAALAVIMLPVDLLREILKHLDTKLLDMHADTQWPAPAHVPGARRPWTGTQRMQNSIRLRRRLGQTGWQIRHRDFEYLDSENDNGYENNWWQE